MNRAEFMSQRVLEAAHNLVSARDIIKERPVFSPDVEKVRAYEAAGVPFASHCMDILSDPDVADAFIEFGRGRRGELVLAIYNEDLRDESDAYIRLVKPKDGQAKFEYVVERKRFLDNTKTYTDDEKYQILNDELVRHSSSETSRNWSLSIDYHTGYHWKIITAVRECSPQDIIKDEFLPSFIRRIIFACGRVEDGVNVRTQNEEKQVREKNEQLVALTEAFKAATEILSPVLNHGK